MRHRTTSLGGGRLSRGWHHRGYLQHIAVRRITRAAPAAPTVSALHDLPGFQIFAGNPADASGAKVGVLRLNAAQAAQLIVSHLAPLRNQRVVGVLFTAAIVKQLLRYFMLPIVHFVNVAAALVVNLKDGPQRLIAALPFVRLSLVCGAEEKEVGGADEELKTGED